MALFKSVATPPAAASPDDAVIAYLLEERIAPQWRVFLRSIADEMRDQLTEDEFRVLLRSVGARMAQRWALGQPQTMDALEDALNLHLESQQWGQVSLDDSGEHLVVLHQLSPLAEGMGLSPALAGGLLEGLYEQWFHSVGAAPNLVARVKDESCTSTECTILFGSSIQQPTPRARS